MQKGLTYALGCFFLLGIMFHGFIFESESLGITSLMFIFLCTIILFSKAFSITKFQLVVILYSLTYVITILYASDTEESVLTAIGILVIIPISLFSGQLTKDLQYLTIRIICWTGGLVAVLGIVFGMYRDQRLESTFQYANALAIFLLIAGLSCFFVALQGKRSVYWYLFGVSLTGVMLTYSRSVWIIWAFAVVAALFIVPKLRNAASLKKLVLVHIISFLSSMAITRDPLFFLSRLKQTTPEASELVLRFIYWKDAFRMWLHYPWGTGGGGWSTLLPAFRSKTYHVKYVHNHYLQTALDSGIVGVVLFFTLVAFFGFKVIRSTKQWNVQEPVQQGIPILVCALLFHAGFDFDLSFPILMGLLIFLMTSYVDEETVEPLIVWKTERIMKKVLLVVPIAIFVGISGYLAAAYSLKEIGQAMMLTSPEQAAEKLDSAEAMVPWSSSIPFERAKSFVVAGNNTGEIQFYHLAKKEIDLAIGLNPKQELYQELEQELNKVLKK